MRNTNKTFAAAVFGIALLSQSLSANMMDDLLEGNFQVWGELTYLKPISGERAYLEQSGASQTGTGFRAAGQIKTRAVCPRYGFGFEAGAGYLARCSGLYAAIYGGWNQSTGTSRIQGFIAPSLPYFSIGNFSGETLGQGFGSLRIEQWYVDGRLGRMLRDTCCSKVHGFLGVRYLRISEKIIASISGNQGDGTGPFQDIRQFQRSHFEGAGPLIGLGGEYDLWCDFGFYGEAAVTALIGRRRLGGGSQEIQQNSAPQTNSFEYDNCMGIAPGLDMKAAANWSMKYGCVTGAVEFGYKLNYYFNAIRATSSQKASATYRDEGFAGPYLSLGLGY